MAERQKVGIEGVLRAGHKGLAVEVPFDPAAEWGTQQAALWPGRRGYPVEVLLNGVRFRSAIVSRMRRFFVLVDESIARRAGSRIGQSVRLTIWADGGFDPKVAQLANLTSSKPVPQPGRLNRRRSQGTGMDLRGKRRGRRTTG
jgi:hypothetical protein